MNAALKSLICDVYYLLFFILTSPVWIARVLTRPSWRAGFLQRWGHVSLPPRKKPRVWVHGVSVGEVLAARSLIRSLSADPRLEVAVSTTTRTGQDVARRTFPELPVFHFPLDLSRFVRRTLRRVDPVLVILVELEVWPNFLLNARRMNVPYTFVNGRITARSAQSYRFLSWILKPEFEKVALFGAQNDEYASRLVHLGARDESVVITGNLKYDNLPDAPDPERIASLRGELGLSSDDRALVGGSIHPGEDKALLAAYGELLRDHPELRLVLVPRHPERFDTAEAAITEAGFACHRRTAGTAPVDGSPVILGDTMGELAALYGAADLVFVGGSLIPHGGQNMMEPAAFGKPVVFGPHCHNFKEEVALLLGHGGAVQVTDLASLKATLGELLADPERAATMGRAARDTVALRRGATERTLSALERSYFTSLLGPPEAESSS